MQQEWNSYDALTDIVSTLHEYLRFAMARRDMGTEGAAALRSVRMLVGDDLETMTARALLARLEEHR